MSYLIIPTWRDPYVVEINGKKYSYKAGEGVDVPREVAEVIQRDIDQHTQDVEPTMTQPKWGKCIGLVPASKSAEWRETDDGNPLNFIEMTREEYASITRATNLDEGGELPLESLYYDADLGGVCCVENDFAVEYMTKGEVTKKIPEEYHGLMIVDMKDISTEETEEHESNIPEWVIARHLKNGGVVITRWIDKDGGVYVNFPTVLFSGGRVDIDGMTSGNGTNWNY